MPIPNDMSSESSPRDVSYADLFSTDTIPTVEVSSMETSLGRGDVQAVVDNSSANSSWDRVYMYKYNYRKTGETLFSKYISMYYILRPTSII